MRRARKVSRVTPVSVETKVPKVQMANAATRVPREVLAFLVMLLSILIIQTH